MEKERFLDLALNYTSLTESETKDLDALQKEFPYSQVIHNLASRGAQDHKLETSKTLLNISAVYSTDRSVLKDIITAPRKERGDNISKEEKTSAPVAPVTPFEVHADELNSEIMHDLERLQKLKHDFEISVEEFEHHKQDHQPAAKAPTVKKKDPPLEPVEAVVAEPSGEGLLEEIKITKKKISPENPRQKEQIEIIDQFIKKQPSIAKNIGSSDGSDLAEKNLSLTDNIVSETLVEILLRQGKKDKAIEVLKKLIWKFPQKKAIFAAQIDELKK